MSRDEIRKSDIHQDKTEGEELFLNETGEEKEGPEGSGTAYDAEDEIVYNAEDDEIAYDGDDEIAYDGDDESAYDEDGEPAYDPETDESEEETAEDRAGAYREQPGRKMKNRRRRNRRKGGKRTIPRKPLIIAGSIAGALLVIYLGVSAFFISHFYINTSINGKDFSGATAAEVEEYLRSQVDGYELTLVEKDGVTDVIKGSDISLQYKENSDIQDALEAQNPLLWITSLFSKTNTDVTIDVEYDQGELTQKIQEIQAVTQEQTDPVSAYPKFDGESFVVEPEVYGTAVDVDALTSKIKEYITEFRTSLDMMEEECYKMPQYTSESPEVQEACDVMNQYCKASVTYTMTENVVVDKALISTWLTYDENMQVSLNQDAVREWMRQFGSTYDTVGATRTITTPTGKTAQVSGGTYGWSIDEETETQNLIASIQNGEVVTREPAYAQTAASHSAQDWGTTYLEVDLSTQHMWYIVDGSIALETDVVTGLPADNRQTPEGVYDILYTERNATLKGEINPSTGKPIYETPVSYWMPFTWQGHGFHDANWQSSFGGSRYQTAGSHGCVNMPVDQAGALFNMLSAGTPVVIHY
ncbi:L,D-transpeptidase family protein [Ruminococcus turbiniformis]|nr:peptidoglycan binding domain-containing protein [Ruminococcus turbiniformis]